MISRPHIRSPLETYNFIETIYYLNVLSTLNIIIVWFSILNTVLVST